MRVSRDFLFEDTPVTMQIAIQAKDGFVLASDIKNIIYGNPLHSLAYHTKIAHCEKHGILISVSGYTADPESDPSAKLANWLDNSATPSRKDFVRWAEEYVAEAKAKNEEDKIRLLIVHPSAEYDKMLKIRIEGGEVKDSPSYKWLVFNGNEDNPAILWPEYFKCEGKHSLGEATCIASLTILTGGDVNPRGVRGLEIFQYTSKWRMLNQSEIDVIELRYSGLKAHLQKFISEAGLTSRGSSGS